MALKRLTFEVGLDSGPSMIIFDARIAMANYLRDYFRSKIEGARNAGVDRTTAMQRASLDWGVAARESRMIRSIPVGLVQWASYAEFNAHLDWFIQPPTDTLGTFDRKAVVAMPGNVRLIRMGGLTFCGVCFEALPADVLEVRVWRGVTANYCTIISGRPDNDDRAEATEPVEPEGADA